MATAGHANTPVRTFLTVADPNIYIEETNYPALLIQ
jgi:hypothetical protein